MNLRALASAFVKEGGIGLALLVLVVLLVWLGGDYLGLSPAIGQAVIVAIFALGVVLFVARRIMARKQVRALASKFEELAEEDADATLPQRKQKQQEIAAQLREGVAHLRLSEHGEASVTTHPWYLVVGPSDAGKSSLLEASGLGFAQMGRSRKPVAEAGSTRDLDWWVTNSAVFLDVPGRFISDSDSPFEWPAFVGALKEARADAPISGVIVVIPVPEIVALKTDEVEPYAKNIRDRLDELSNQCKWVFPVYVAFSKCDRIKGFKEAFGSLAEEERRGLWGTTLPFAVDENRNYRTIFHDECNRLADPLRQQVLAALASDGPPAIKEQTALFPRQMFLAQRRMGEVLGAVFRPNPFIETGLLRGFYFVSATQGGPSLDLVLESTANESPIAASERAPFFISQLFAEILPPDRYLARLSVKEGKRRRALNTAAATFSIAACIVLAALMTMAFADRQESIQRLQAASGDNLVQVDALRQALVAADDKRPLTTSLVPFPGNPEAKAVNAGRVSYFKRLQAILIQPTANRLQEEAGSLRNRSEKSIKDYDVLLAKLLALRMLNGRLEPRPEVLRPEFDATAAALAADASSRQLLFQQADYLLSQPERFKEYPASTDSQLLEALQTQLAGALWIEAAFSDILKAAPADLPALARDDLVAGPGRDFVQLSRAVPGLFTQQGYDSYVAGAIASQAARLATRFAQLGENKPAWSVAAELNDRYLLEHAAAWRNAQESFSVRDFDSLPEAVMGLRHLCGPESAMRELMRGLREGGALKLADGSMRQASSDDLKWLDQALALLHKLPLAMDEMLQATSRGSHLLEYQASGKLDALVKTFNEVAAGMDDVLVGAPKEIRDQSTAAIRRLLNSAIEELRQEAQQEAEFLWRTDVQEVFQSDLAAFYPFSAQALSEAPLGAFARMFNPKSGRLWRTLSILNALREQVTNRQPLVEFSAGFSEAIERAASLRDALFLDGTEAMAVNFNVTLERGEGAADMSLSSGDKSVTCNGPGGRKGELSWTQEKPLGARVQVRLGDDRWLQRDHATQNWGMVRMFAAASRTMVSETRVKCAWVFTYDVGGAKINVLGYAEFEFKGAVFAFDPELYHALALPQRLK